MRPHRRGGHEPAIPKRRRRVRRRCPPLPVADSRGSCRRAISTTRSGRRCSTPSAELPWYPITRAEMRLLRARRATFSAAPTRPTASWSSGRAAARSWPRSLAPALPQGRRSTCTSSTSRPPRSHAAASALLGPRPACGSSTHEARTRTGSNACRQRGAAPGRALVAVPRLEHRQLRSARRASVPRAHPARAGAGRRAADRRRPGEAGARSARSPTTTRSASPRRSTATCSCGSIASSAAISTLHGFRHRAVWNAARVPRRDAPGQRASRSACPRRARRPRPVTLEGETIWTESSYKYTPEEIRRLLWSCGFHESRQWIDEPGRFALTLAST